MIRSRRRGPWTRLLVALLCAMQLGLAFGVGHRGHEPSICGTASPAAVAALAEIDAGVFADAWRALSGSDGNHCSGCPGVVPAPPATSAAHAAPRSTEPPPGAAVPLGASRFGLHKPPSTAPPVRA
ncbi:MAG TPA: hypothetical protein VEA81_08495 [Burkholderiaceae bacterium]|nr:hypothetical protein [Burkholderiaceae bacterium]